MSMHVSKLSAVHRGAAFEERSLQLLCAHFSMTLRRVGGTSDGGIDLVGWWWLPFTEEQGHLHRPVALRDTNGLLRRRLRVIAQCKAEKKKFSSIYVREMEGVWHHQSTSPTSPTAHPQSLSHLSHLADKSEARDAYPTVALLLSESPFSRSTTMHAYRSTVPFLLIHLPPASSSGPSKPPLSIGDIELGTAYPNPALTRLVTPLVFLWERGPFNASPTEKNAPICGRPGLWWKGRRLGNWTPDSPNSDVA